MKKIVAYIVKLINQFLVKFGLNDETRQAFVKYFFNTGWMFAEKVLMLVVTFFVGIYVTRYLGPDRFGMLSYAYSFVIMFQIIAKLGLDGIVIRELVNKPENKKKLLGTSFIIKLTGSIISFILIAVAIEAISIENVIKQLILIIGFGLLFTPGEVFSFYFESTVQAKYNAIAISITTLLISIFKVALVYMECELKYFALVYCLEFVIRGSLLLMLYLRNLNDIKEWTFSKQLAKELIRNSSPLIISSMAVFVYMKIDILMIKEFLNEEAVGHYTVAVHLSEIWFFIPTTITASLFPAILNAKKRGEQIYHKRLQLLFSFLIYLSFLIALPISLLSSKIINILYNADYLATIPVLKIHIWSCVLVFTGNLLSKWQLAENEQKIMSYRYISGAISNVFLNFFLIPKYGIIGASISTLISFFIVMYFSCIFFKSMHKILIIQLKAVLPTHIIRFIFTIFR